MSSDQTGRPSSGRNAPSKTEAALAAVLVDQAGTTVKPGKQEIIDIDDTFCAAHGGQQLVFWNSHHDERGFASSMQSRGKPMVTRNERSGSFRCNAQIRTRSEVQRTYRKLVGGREPTRMTLAA